MARLIVVVLAFVLTSIGGFVAWPTAPLRAQEATPEEMEVGGVTVLPPDAPYAGVSRAEWSAHFLQWALSLPQEANPKFDPNGEQCGYGQSGPVFFLPAAYVPEPYDRTCVVPEGAAIYVQVGGSSCSSVEPPPYFGRDEADLQACAAAEAYAVPHTVAINGQPLPDLQAYRTTSPAFALRLAADNLLGAPPGVALAVMAGSSIIVAPPPPGEYEITLTADFGGEVLPGTTQVIVEASQVIEPATPGVGTPGATPAA